MLKVRLARFGAKKRPYYKIVVANATSPRDGKFIVVLGNYDPMKSKNDPTRYNLDLERFKYWISCGAQPTKVVERIVKILQASDASSIAA